MSTVLKRICRRTAEVLALAPDLVVANGTPVAAALQHASRNVPIVFVGVVDPVAADLVDSLAHPGGNATGFTLFEYGLSGKWLELLKEVAPGIARVAVMRDPTIASGAGQLGAIQAAAASSAVELKPVNVSDAREIERAIASIATGPTAGLIVVASPLAITHRDLIISLAARYKLPAVYTGRLFVASGGLISYGPDYVDQYRQAAGYVDPILKGEKPADLPVQAPTNNELIINLKTAKILGLTIPQTLLSTADEVIDEAARIHHASWRVVCRRRRRLLAACSARAAAGDAGHRIPQWRIARRLCADGRSRSVRP